MRTEPLPLGEINRSDPLADTTQASKGARLRASPAAHGRPFLPCSASCPTLCAACKPPSRREGMRPSMPKRVLAAAPAPARGAADLTKRPRRATAARTSAGRPEPRQRRWPASEVGGCATLHNPLCRGPNLGIPTKPGSKSSPKSKRLGSERHARYRVRAWLCESNVSPAKGVRFGAHGCAVTPPLRL